MRRGLACNVNRRTTINKWEEDMRHSKKLSVAVLVVFVALTMTFGTAFAAKKPNIVLVFLDNFGWGEPGFNGGGIIRGAETLRMDTLASEGLRLTNFNVESQCTPSRSAIMTGRYAIRSGCGKAPQGGGVYGLVQWEVTMAEMLSDAGYATGMFGKWHLGRTPGRFPTDQGFDEWYGIPNSTDEAPYMDLEGFKESGLPEASFVMEAKKGETPKKMRPYRLDYRPFIDADLTDKAIDFMKRKSRSKKPFFCFLPYTATHYPTRPHPDFAGKSGNGPWADLLLQIDAYTGRLLDTIDELGIRENTIFIFIGDKGNPYPQFFQGVDIFPWLSGAFFLPVAFPGKTSKLKGQLTSSHPSSDTGTGGMNFCYAFSCIQLDRLPANRILQAGKNLIRKRKVGAPAIL